jgi:hypothetical protein
LCLASYFAWGCFSKKLPFDEEGVATDIAKTPILAKRTQKGYPALNKRSVIVIGGAGCIGSHACKAPATIFVE